jgi:tetratricopeptide (TPR) repeat protein
LTLGVLIAAIFLAAPQQDLLQSGQSAFQKGDLPRAEADFRAYLKAHPNSAEGLSNLAAVHARRGQFGEAAPLYEKALRANPKLVPVHFNYAVTLGQLKEYVKAADHLRTFLKSYPTEARAHQLLGLCLMESGDARGALSALEKSYALNPKDGSILYALAYANARAGEEKRAGELLSRVEGNPTQAKLIEGLIMYRRGMWAEAKGLFEQVVNADPNIQPAVAALGRLELLERNDGKAIALLERAVQLNAQDAESWYQLGVLYDRNGRTREAYEPLKKAIALRANYADPHYQLGRILLREGRPAEALSELEIAKKMLPDQEAIRLALGRAYQAQGRTSEARVEFDEVRRLKAAVIERDRLRVESDTLMKPDAEKQ